MIKRYIIEGSLLWITAILAALTVNWATEGRSDVDFTMLSGMLTAIFLYQIQILEALKNKYKK